MNIAASKTIAQEATFTQKPKLSVIIPFRNDHAIKHLIPRLSFTCLEASNVRDIEFIVADSGSDIESARQISAICADNNVKYVYHPTEGQVFSIGEARDFGVMHASADVVTFIDIDFRFPTDFWGRLVSFIRSFGLPGNKKSFFVVPLLYLTQDGTAEFEHSVGDERFSSILLKWLHGDTDTVQNMAPCSSIIVVNRLHYLSIGGHRKEFRGHGYEDFELVHRLLDEDKTIQRAENYYKDNKAWDASTYNGFRAQFALLGRPAMIFNLFGVHLWHPRPKAAGFYNSGAMKANRDAWMGYFQEYDKNKEHPEPLACKTSGTEKNLFLGEPRTNNSRIFREIFPLLGSIHYATEMNFIDDDGNVSSEYLEKTISQLGITRIVFPNPYGNKNRLAIYKWCKENGYKILVFDRGALPYSWFFDPNGFNADSTSYARENWDIELTDKERRETRDRINYYLYHADALEHQGERIGAAALGTKLKTGGKKVLFVPLQRPSDSVIKHFAGGEQGYSRFIEAVDQAAKRLRRYGWIVLVKKHPLETEAPNFEHAQYVNENTHFIDLLELSDAVALINSGVGIYAMMAGKPCYTFGETFYGIKDVNVSIENYDVDYFCEQLMLGAKVNNDSVTKFLHFLNNRFYSFGLPASEKKRQPDGSYLNLTRYIDFKQIRLPGLEPVIFNWQTPSSIPLHAPLFERYRLDIYQRKEAATKAAKIVEKAVAIPIVKKEEPKLKEENKPLPVIINQTPANNMLPAPVTTQLPAVISDVDVKRAKIEKLKKKPRQFFNDSKNPVIRPFRHFFKG